MTTEQFQPFVGPEERTRELTIRALLVGSFLGVIFAASSVYLGLKVGLTVSASIPIAVLSITLFKALARSFRMSPAPILENNIVQTTGSAGESIAAGVAFTLPALLLMGFELESGRILLVALFGGLIGVLMMIPLRHGLIVQEHGRLTYPEGTACANVLVVGERGGTSARTVFIGFFTGLGYAILNLIARLWSDTAVFAVDFWGRLRGGMLAFEVSPPMLGVGYIIGPRVAANMMAGGCLAYLVLIPLVHLFGDAIPAPLYPETSRRIETMTPAQIRDAYVLYVGAGAVATGGFIALGRAIPTILSAFLGGIGSMRRGRAPRRARLRTERDLPQSIVFGGCLAIGVAIWLAPVLGINLLSTMLIILFGFFFVTVSSRITGEMGSSANPISGMTVATLLITCGLFVLIGWKGVEYKAIALTTAALVCVAASNGGTISQDLKTGFLVGATPRAQQIAIMVGVLTSAIVIGSTLLILNEGSATYKALAPAAHFVPLTGSETKATGPDQRSYHVFYLKDDAHGLRPGKYLVNDNGEAAFLVDPGVCGGYPYQLVPHAGGGTLSPGDSAETELGIDRRTYNVVVLAKDQGTLVAGRYLVADDGRVAYDVHTKTKFDAPKAQIFRLIIDGTLGGRLPWGLVLAGVFLALMMELVGVAALPFAVGLYLPISTSAGIFVGGLVRGLAERKRARAGVSGDAADSESSSGMLMASGLIAGGAIAGVVQSVIAFYEKESLFDLSGALRPLSASTNWWPMLLFLWMAAALYRAAARSR